MKKKIFVLLSFLMIVPVVVSASENYVNYNGIEMSEEEYSNLLAINKEIKTRYHFNLSWYNKAMVFKNA